MALSSRRSEILVKALDDFRIELPSWGFSNTGTRFGKFIQAAAASTLEEKFSDAGEVHRCHGGLPHASRCTCCGTCLTASTARRK